MSNLTPPTAGGAQPLLCPINPLSSSSAPARAQPGPGGSRLMDLAHPARSKDLPWESFPTDLIPASGQWKRNSSGLWIPPEA